MYEEPNFNFINYLAKLKNKMKKLKRIKKLRRKKIFNIKVNKLSLKIFAKNIILYSNFFKLKSLHKLYNYNKINVLSLLKYYNKYLYKNKDYFKLLDYKNYLIFIIDLRKKSPKLIFLKNDKIILNLTPGIITKKLELKEKHIKKHIKILSIMIRSSINNLKKIYNYKHIIINIKGVRKDLFRILSIIKNANNNNNTYYIYSPFIKYDKYCFKKIKSIKRKLRKKFIKL